MAYERVDWKTESKNLKDSIGDDDNIERICSDEDDTILYDIPTGRELRFRLTPHTAKSAAEILHIGRSCDIDDKEKASIISKIIQLPPELMLNCRGIIIAESYRDLKDCLTDLSIEEDNLTEQLLNEDADDITDSLVGLHWYQECMVVINMKLIKSTAKELTKDRPWRYKEEAAIGFWTTLLHELRHNQIDAMIYDVPWLKKEDATESAVEAWALDYYENSF